MQFTIIAAMDRNQGIGKDGSLPWNLPTDMKLFKTITMGCNVTGLPNAVIFGRKTYESIPAKHRPLKGRMNVVLTNNVDLESPDAYVFHNLDSALVEADRHCCQLYVAGGGNVYEQAIRHPSCQELILTHVVGTFDCDTWFPVIPTRFRVHSILAQAVNNGVYFRVVRYTRIAC